MWHTSFCVPLANSQMGPKWTAKELENVFFLHVQEEMGLLSTLPFLLHSLFQLLLLCNKLFSIYWHKTTTNLFFKLDLLGQHWLTKLCRFQVYSPSSCRLWSCILLTDVMLRLRISQLVTLFQGSGPSRHLSAVPPDKSYQIVTFFTVTFLLARCRLLVTLAFHFIIVRFHPVLPRYTLYSSQSSLGPLTSPWPLSGPPRCLYCRCHVECLFGTHLWGPSQCHVFPETYHHNFKLCWPPTPGWFFPSIRLQLSAYHVRGAVPWRRPRNLGHARGMNLATQLSV